MELAEFDALEAIVKAGILRRSQEGTLNPSESVAKPGGPVVELTGMQSIKRLSHEFESWDR